MSTVGSLFSGIGGLDLGLERAGWEVRWQVENDPFCQTVLAKHWPHVQRYGDIKTLDPERLERIDLICGGFPCQSVSVAGKRLAQADARWLWPEFARIIRGVRPRFVLVENVPGLLHRGIGDVLGDLAACGYDAEWQSLRAADVGAPHRRERVFIVAYAQQFRRWERGDASPNRNEKETALACAVADAEGQPRALRSAEGERPGRSSGGGVVVPNSDESPAGHGHNGTSPIFARRPGQDEGGRLAIPTEQQWDVEPDVGRVAHGLSLELDIARGLANEQGDGEEAESATRFRVGRFLRAVWELQGLAATSPDVYLQRLRDSVPGLPHGDTRSRWLLGARLQKIEGLRDMWATFYAQPLEEAHDVQRQLLERIGKTQRPQALGSCVDRLRGLGNAVVPQVAEWIGRRLLEALG